MAAENSISFIEKFMALRNNSDPAATASFLAENADPKVRLMAQLLSRHQEEALQSGRDNDVHDEHNTAVQNQSDTNKKLHRLRRRIEMLNKEVDYLQEINDTLAAALGACYLCWGDDADCEMCHGQGRPGAVLPDRGLYKEFVVPAIKRASAKKVCQPSTLKEESE